MEDPTAHYFEVVIDVLDFHNDTLRLVMPTWTPGSYLIREFSRNVLDLVAFDIDEDTILETKKMAKNIWEVECKNINNVRIKYRVYAFDFSVDTSFLDSQHAVINGASVFMYVEGYQNERFALTVIPYENWREVSTGLHAAPNDSQDEWSFEVPNYDILVDSPIEVGNQDIESFVLNGITYEVSIFSQRELDRDAFVSDLKKIVENTVAVFGIIPYERYVFLVDFCGDNYGGLEHLNSTHCIAPIFRFEPIQEYRQLLSLFSHEFFHAWNVKRMRPEGLGPFNYSAETYTRSLWIAEGITSYYDDMLLRRAKIYSVAEYLDAFSLNINIMKSLPGSRWQSAEEASFDTWIKHYRQDENSPNVYSSYYVQGTVIGWMLDMEIRKKTANQENLDNALRMLYDTYSKENRGYNDDDFERICASLIGKENTREIFDSRVRGRKDIDFNKYLSYSGLKIVPKKPQQSEQGFLGVRIRQDSGRLVVTNVLSESPAQISGLASSDEVIAVDQIRMDSGKFTWYVTNRKPETPVTILVSRFGALMEITAETTTKPIMEYRVAKLEVASAEQKELFRSWLFEDWEAEIKYEEYSPSPSRKSVFDYI